MLAGPCWQGAGRGAPDDPTAWAPKAIPRPPAVSLTYTGSTRQKHDDAEGSGRLLVERAGWAKQHPLRGPN